MFNTKHLCSRSFLVAAAGSQSLWSLSLAIVYIYALLVMQSLQNNQIVTLFAIGDKVMKNQEAVDIVKPIKDPQAAAKRLTTEALARKSKDDISCIAIRFG